MKILVGTSSPPDRGAGILTYTRNLVEELVARDIEVHLCAPEPKDKTWLTQIGVQLFVADSTSPRVELARKLVDYLSKEEFDAVINNDSSLVQSIAPVLSCPMIAIGHCQSTAIAVLACHNVEWLDYLVAISSDMQMVFVENFSVPLEKCRLVHNGTPLPAVPTLTRRRDGMLNIVFAGGYSPFKGGSLLAASLKGNGAELDGLHLDWYGAISAKKAKRISSAASLPIAFKGRVPQSAFHGALADADVLLFPSRAEGCPMALLEAMALGVVPISSDGPGAMRWIISSGLDGYVCPRLLWKKNLLPMLRQLRNNPDQVLKMKKAAMRKIENEFTVAQMTSRLLDLLSVPTVDRSPRPSSIAVLRDHRPGLSHGVRPTLSQRIAMKCNHLSKAGVLHLGS